MPPSLSSTFEAVSEFVGSPRPRRIDWRDTFAKFGILAATTAILLFALQHRTHDSAFALLRHHPVGRPFLLAGLAYAALSFAWSLWRLVLALRYLPTPLADWSLLPTLTVIVPVFNEESMIARTLRALIAATYPRDRLQIIVIDDGSTDETWREISSVASAYPDLICAIQLPCNCGKRHALAEGFRRATGDVLVTVDSDSLIDATALRAIVSPLAADPSVGAVAGNVRVLNRSGGLIPRMLDVRYVMTFDYKRAAQSMMSGGGVLCVAGALAAYRRAAVVPVLDQWLNQTWLGRPARAGEDHAMTNFVRRQGYAVRFQRTARVRTLSPTTYSGIAKMFLRWARSNIRETAHLSRFIFQPRATLPGMHAAPRPHAALADTLPIGLPPALDLTAPRAVPVQQNHRGAIAPSSFEICNSIFDIPSPARGRTSPSRAPHRDDEITSTRPATALRANFLMTAIGLILPYAFLTTALTLAILSPAIFGMRLLTACALGGLFPLAFCAGRERTTESIWAIAYCFFAMLLLFWVWPYALFTSHKSVWLTRAADA